MYNKEALIEKLINVIKDGYKHKYYDHTVKVSQFWTQIMTGDDQKDLVISYKPSENDTQKQQRIRLYNSRTSYAANKIVSTFKEVERIEEISNKIYFKQNDEVPEELIQRFENYDGKFKIYIHDVARRLNFYDPNAFVVTEFYKKNNQSKPFAYPLEVMSHCVYDYEYKYGELKYLIICNFVEILAAINLNQINNYPIVRPLDFVKKEARQFTIYGIEWSIRITEHFDAPTDLDIITINNQKYTYEEFNTKFTTVPAVQIGYIKDPTTKWQTYESPLLSAKHIFKDLINTKSEYDLARALHGFIQKFAYVEKCDYVHEDNEMFDRCDGGKLKVTGSKCPSCHGSGKKIHTTVQDVVLITLPSEKSEHIPLSEFIYYQEIPKHIIDSYKIDIADLEKDISLAIFNKDTFTQSEVSTTATEIRLNKQSVYNVLYEFGANVSRLFTELGYQIADVLGIRDLIQIDFEIPKDFQMESLEDLIQIRRNAMSSGVPYDIINNIDKKILFKQNQDNFEFVDQIAAQDKWRPFKDKSESERISIISMLPDDDYDKTLYVYFDKIFMQIWSDIKYNNFHKLKYNIQKTIIDQKVNDLINAKKPIEETQIRGLINGQDSKEA
jgi:hypothetical protein